jgi:DNA-binding HxlR family transcriptional regulator
MAVARRTYYCTVEVALDRLKGKWKPAIIYHLKHGSVRFGELRRLLPGVSTKMLTLHLRQLEADDIVQRRVSGTPRLREVTYTLSPRAAEIRTVLDQLHRWGDRYASKRGIRTVVGP